jgi:hypothetical protein
MRSHHVLPIAILGLLLELRPDVSLGQTPDRRAVSRTATCTDSRVGPVPSWLAWKAFHESLRIRVQRSGQGPAKTLESQFGLSSYEVKTLVDIGQQFLETLAGIDRDARAAVQARYGADPPPSIARSRNPRNENDRIPGRPIVLERGKTLLDMVRASGLYHEVEAKKRAALGNHLQALQSVIASDALNRMHDWISGSVAPQIRVAECGSPVSSVNRSSPGQTIYLKKQGQER